MTPAVRLASCVAIIAALAAPAFSQTVTLARVGSIPGPADMIKVQDRYAYVSSGKTLTVVDIGDPAAPRRAGSYTFPELVWGFALAGPTAYVAADLFGLGILDVSNPAAPVLRGSLKTPGQAKNVALVGNRALVADHVSGIDVIDVTTPERPRLIESFFVDGFAKDVIARGTLAYALDQPSGLYVYDVAKSGTVEPSAMVTLAVPIALRAQLAVSEASSSGPRLAVVAGGGPLQVYDVSNPAAMARAAIYRTPGAAQRVSLRGTRAYVADGPSGLQVIDLSTPAAPGIVGSHETAMPARDVEVAGSLVFVVVGNEEVLILQQGQ